jgi:hypothetical protein
LKKSSITGRVVDDTGQPLISASVTMMPAGGNPGPSNEVQTVKSDEDGSFSFNALSDKPYTLTVWGFEDSTAGLYYLPGESITIQVERGAVITGRVTSVDGEPLVGIQVFAKCIRGKGDKPLVGSNSAELSRTRMTDDRGIYRFWGLRPGTYIVSAGRMGGNLITEYDDDSPTYYPSSTLASAAQLVVNSGQELTGIDISYRGYKGHAVSGAITGGTPPHYLEVCLATLGGLDIDGAWLQAAQSAVPFAFARVSDGEYLLTAVRTSGKEILAITPPKAVTVKGADVTGISLNPVPLGSLSGTVQLENDPNLPCAKKTNNALTETVLSLRREGRQNESYPSLIESQLTYAASPDGKGQFAMKRVPPGDYRLEPWLPNEDWYVSAIAAGSGPQQVDAGSKGISIGQGQVISTLNVVIKGGAAGLSGRIVPASTGSTLPSAMRIHLVPADPKQADQPLRFAETEVAGDGSFKFKNLAPGSYRIVARPVEDKDSATPSAYTAQGRARLLREAKNKALVIDLQPCQRQADYVLKYRPRG